MVVFWVDVWLEDLSLAHMALQQLTDDALECRVTDYLENNRGWRWEASSNLLPTSTLIEMASHVVVESDLEQDEITWSGSHNDDFSVRSAYVCLEHKA